jgi:hypothetical protein
MGVANHGTEGGWLVSKEDSIIYLYADDYTLGTDAYAYIVSPFMSAGWTHSLYN